MRHTTRSIHATALAGVASGLCIGMISGCEAQRKEDIQAGANPNPIGTSTNEHFRRQAEKAEYDDFVIYRYEWARGGTELGPQGERHLQSIVPRMWKRDWTVVLQPTGDETLDSSRKEVIISRLTMNDIPNAAQRVVIGDPLGEGMSGEEAISVQRSFPFGTGGAK